MRLDNEIRLDFKDVLFRPKRSTLSSRSQVSLERTFKMKNSGRTWTGVPVVAANMDTTGTFEMALALAKFKMITAVHKFYSVEQWAEFMNGPGKGLEEHIAVSTGILEKDLEKLDQIIKACPNLVIMCVDVANGYTEMFVEVIVRLRKTYPTMTIMAGNVVTPEMSEELIISGADIVKVGIGPGSVCTTRRQTGVGYPQLSAVMECADAAHGLGGHIISDGGCTCPGDVAKAFGAGSDFVMLGGMLAGHDESGGEVVEEENGKFKYFYGMSSATAMNKYAGGVASHRSAEGKTVKVPYRGPVSETLLDITGGVRSTCTYVGAATLRELSKRTTFIRVSQQINQVFDANHAGEPARKKPATEAAVLGTAGDATGDVTPASK